MRKLRNSVCAIAIVLLQSCGAGDDENQPALLLASLADRLTPQTTNYVLPDRSYQSACEIVDIIIVSGCAGDDYCWVEEIVPVYDCTGAGGGGPNHGSAAPSTDLPADGFEGPPGGGGGNGNPGAGGNSAGAGSVNQIGPRKSTVDPAFSMNFPCHSAVVQQVFATRTPVTGLVQAIFGELEAPTVSEEQASEEQPGSPQNEGPGDRFSDRQQIRFTAAALPQYGFQTGAFTDPYRPHSYEITINTERFDRNATDLDLAMVVTHESLHAVMLHFFYSGQTPEYDDDQEPPAWAGLISNFAENSQAGQSADTAHELMATLTDEMADVVYDWAVSFAGYNPEDFADPDPLNEADGLKEYLRLLAWAGLTDTEAFANEFPSVFDEENPDAVLANAVRAIHQSEMVPDEAGSTAKGRPVNGCN